MPTDLDVALEAANAAAAIIRSYRRVSFTTSFKGAVDPVTQVDEDAEGAIVGVISAHRPDDHLVGEERGGGFGDGRTWIVDPLDGTVNFIHGLPHFAVSVALWNDGEPMVGVVVDVEREEVFSASRGEGSLLDGSPIEVSGVSNMERALAVTGFPYDRQERAAEYSSALGRVMRGVMGVRRLGSAALDFAWIACGRLDGYWEPALAPWDAAAGIILVEEAGGSVTGYGGAPHRLGAEGVVATNGLFHDAFVELVGDRP